MAAALAKLTILVGAGIAATVLTKEGNSSNVTGFFSGALRIFRKHLQQDKDDSSSAGKPKNDFLIAQVNNLRQQLQILQSSGSVTIVTANGSGYGTYSVTSIVVIGVVGYGYIWWKGWKLSDMMFVTQRSLSDACNSVAKQLVLVSSSISSTKQHLSSRIDRADCNLSDCLEVTAATKDEVSKLQGELSGFHVEVESVHRAVQTLETKLGRIEGSQDLATRGVYHLCEFVKNLEQGKSSGHILPSPSSSSRPALESPQVMPVTRVESSPPLLLASEPSSPSTSTETPKVLRSATTVSAAGLKELQGLSNSVRTGNFRSTSAEVGNSEVSNVTPVNQEPGHSGSSGSGRFGWKLPSLSVLTRSRSAADAYK